MIAHTVQFLVRHSSRCLPPAVVLCWCCLAAGSAAAGDVDPREFGIDLPPGPLRPAGDRRVLTDDDLQTTVVAKVHAQIGDNYVVMLPDGRLVARRPTEVETTERPFQAAAKDDLANRITTHLKDFKTRQTGRYLFVYNTTEAFAEAASTILETMHKGIELHATAQKIDVRPPEVPLVVIMFRTEDEFQAFRRMPPGVVAYYDSLSNQVVLYEEAKHSALKRELAIQQSLATIAHEGAHQILNNIGVQQRLSVWPMWLAEGLAEYFAPTTTGARLRWKGAGQVNDLRMFELEQYLNSRSGDGLDGTTIEQTVLAARLTSAGYASAWSLTHYLAKTPAYRPKFNELVKQMSELGPLEGNMRIERPGIIRANLVTFEALFGDDLAGMEKRLVVYLKRLPYTPPFADYPHYVAMLSSPNGNRVERTANIFFSSALAEKWLSDALGAMPAEQRDEAQTRVHECANRQAALAFTRHWLSNQ